MPGRAGGVVEEVGRHTVQSLARVPAGPNELQPNLLHSLHLLPFEIYLG